VNSKSSCNTINNIYCSKSSNIVAILLANVIVKQVTIYKIVAIKIAVPILIITLIVIKVAIYLVGAVLITIVIAN